MGTDTKTQLGIFIDDLPIGCVVVDVSRNELFVFQRRFDQSANFLTPVGWDLLSRR
jgi:hypothetical protein